MQSCHLENKLRPEDHNDHFVSQDPEKVTKNWLDFATLISAIHRNNKFCLCLARRNQSRRKNRKENLKWPLSGHTDSVDNI